MDPLERFVKAWVTLLQTMDRHQGIYLLPPGRDNWGFAFYGVVVIGEIYQKSLERAIELLVRENPDAVFRIVNPLVKGLDNGPEERSDASTGPEGNQ